MVERTPFDVWGEGCRRFECEGVGRGLIEPFLVTVEVILARKKVTAMGCDERTSVWGTRESAMGLH
jgi:hypothetical protein